MNMTVRFHRYGGPEVLQLEDDAVGPPLAGQVRLRHEAIGVNFIDTLFRQGVFPMPLPGVTGVEGAGVIDAVGPGVSGFKRGDRVAYYLSPGSYAEVRLVQASALVPIPADIAPSEAATVLTKGLTAWTALNGFHRLEAGQTVLVQGASSNVGTLIARWARERGATVAGTTGSPGKLTLVAEYVDHALLSGAPDLVERLRDIPPSGFDVVYDLVGAVTFEGSSAAVRDGGTVVMLGAASGQPDVGQSPLHARGVRITGGPMAQHLEGMRDRATHEVFDAYRRGVFGEYVATAYPLRCAAKAHDDIASRRKTGPMILVP